MGEPDTREQSAAPDVVAPDTEGDATVAPTPTKPKIWDIDLPQTPATSTSEQRIPEHTNPGQPNPVQTDAVQALPASKLPKQPLPETDETSAVLARCAESPLSPALRERPRPARDKAKTRLLGFHTEETTQDVFDAPAAVGQSSNPRFPIGWIVVVDGPGRGASFTLTTGLSTVGRDPGQTVSLDFGDAAISRGGHVAIAHDEEENRTYVGHGGKSNIVRRNDKPLLSTEELSHGDIIRIGKTSLQFVAFCTADFAWDSAGGSASEDQNG